MTWPDQNRRILNYLQEIDADLDDYRDFEDHCEVRLHFGRPDRDCDCDCDCDNCRPKGLVMVDVSPNTSEKTCEVSIEVLEVQFRPGTQEARNLTRALKEATSVAQAIQDIIREELGTRTDDN